MPRGSLDSLSFRTEGPQASAKEQRVRESSKPLLPPPPTTTTYTLRQNRGISVAVPQFPPCSHGVSECRETLNILTRGTGSSRQ